MKVYAISDLHLSVIADKPMDLFGDGWTNHFDVIKQDWLKKVQPDDVVLLCGDLSWAMRSQEVEPDLALVAPLPGHKVIIRGNHDYWWNTIGQVRSLLPIGFYALQNDSLRIGDYVFFGTRGWTCPEQGKPFCAEDEKLYKREIERLKLSIASMNKIRKEEDKVICLMHFPPFNAHYDCSEFVTLLLQADVKTVVYGHLHGKDSRSQLLTQKYGIQFYLTSCDLLSNKLVEIVTE